MTGRFAVCRLSCTLIASASSAGSVPAIPGPSGPGFSPAGEAYFRQHPAVELGGIEPHRLRENWGLTPSAEAVPVAASRRPGHNEDTNVDADHLDARAARFQLGKAKATSALVTKMSKHVKIAGIGSPRRDLHLPQRFPIEHDRECSRFLVAQPPKRRNAPRSRSAPARRSRFSSSLLGRRSMSCVGRDAP